MIVHRLVRSFVLMLGLLAVGLVLWSASYGTPQRVNASGLLSASPTPLPPLPEPKLGQLDKEAIAKIDLEASPILPKISDHVLAIYQDGLAKGNNPDLFSKLGDCMTATEDFMVPFAKKEYSLGEYKSLQAVIDYYLGVPVQGQDARMDSFSNPGLAATSGFNTASVLDSTWSDPKYCTADESPLACEFRVTKPSIALVMFGTNDIKSLKPEQYDFYLRQIIVQTVNAGIVPVVSTFPVQPGLEDASKLFNQITVKAATDYDVPLINLWLAFKPLPHGGIDPKNSTHMTKPDDGHTAYFTDADLQAGYNMRNLITLQALEAVLKAVDPKFEASPK